MKKKETANSRARNIPKMDVLLADERCDLLLKKHPAFFVKDALRKAVSEIREGILDGSLSVVPQKDAIFEKVSSMLAKSPFTLKRVVNATGVILHTNLGRAPLGKDIIDHLEGNMESYSNLEYDSERGKRGSRYDHVSKILCDLTGAEDALVVNNNAAAVFIVLNTLAKEKKVSISRGELVEIGGSFRIPDIMKEAGAILCEVGTTNKTRMEDFEKSLDDGAEIFLKVHRSNFSIKGFSEDASLKDMAYLIHSNGGILIEDLGAGFLLNPSLFGFHHGESVKKHLEEGADIVCFSGDKLTGGPQAGIILGKKDLLEKIKKNQLLRIIRTDKISLALLEKTLIYYKDPYLAKEKIPVLRMFFSDEGKLRERAEKLSEIIKKNKDYETRLIKLKDEAGGGSLPEVILDGWGVSLSSKRLKTKDLEEGLRKNDVPIISRIIDDKTVFSTRTLFESDMDIIGEFFNTFKV